MSEPKEMPFNVPLIDIAQTLARAGFLDARGERYRLCEEWARDFQADFEARAAAGRDGCKVDRAFSFGGLRGVYDAASMEAFLPIATELRKLAGFSDDEIAEVVAAGPTIKT